MPCCECGEMMGEISTKTFYVCACCRAKSVDKDLDELWDNYLRFLFPIERGLFGREMHYSAWQMGLLGNRETVEFLAFSFRNS